MFRKLHSNRDPRDTLSSELRKEFGVYFGKAENGIRHLLGQYPKQAYGSMVVLMLISMTLSFTMFRHHEAEPVTAARVSAPPIKVPVSAGSPGLLSPVSSGFDQILETGSALKQTIDLKKQIDMLLAKKELTAADSISLDQAVSQLQQINKHLNPNRR
jgi:hypothetical protein